MIVCQEWRRPSFPPKKIILAIPILFDHKTAKEKLRANLICWQNAIIAVANEFSVSNADRLTQFCRILVSKTQIYQKGTPDWATSITIFL